MRGNLVRRLVAFCAVAVTVFAAFAAVRLNRVATVSAAGGPGTLKISAIPLIFDPDIRSKAHDKVAPLLAPEMPADLVAA